MLGDRLIEINQFRLYYDGIFLVQFEFRNRKYRKELYLAPAMLIKLLQNEGLVRIDSENLLDFCSEGVEFSKSTLLFDVFDNENGEIGFLTSNVAELYQDSGHYLIHCDIKADE
jgi:hypothetical protein